VKHIDLKTFAIPESIAARAAQVRATYFDAVRDWVKHGEKSRFALSPAEVAKRAHGPGECAARGHACFAIGAWLWRNGKRDASKRWFEEAVAAQPDNWAFRRQKIAVAEDAAIGNFAATPEFWLAVQKTAAAGERYYDLIDVLVYPRLSNRLTELVTPLKPLEAMAQGALVIASDVGGHRELIRDGETGVLFEAGSCEGLVAAISRLLRERDRWEAYRAKAREFVQSERNWRTCVERYREVYQTVARDSGHD